MRRRGGKGNFWGGYFSEIFGNTTNGGLERRAADTLPRTGGHAWVEGARQDAHAGGVGRTRSSPRRGPVEKKKARPASQGQAGERGGWIEARSYARAVLLRSALSAANIPGTYFGDGSARSSSLDKRTRSLLALNCAASSRATWSQCSRSI